jgi:hypothetical protein
VTNDDNIQALRDEFERKLFKAAEARGRWNKELARQSYQEAKRRLKKAEHVERERRGGRLGSLLGLEPDDLVELSRPSSFTEEEWEETTARDKRNWHWIMGPTPEPLCPRFGHVFLPGGDTCFYCDFTVEQQEIAAWRDENEKPNVSEAHIRDTRRLLAARNAGTEQPGGYATIQPMTASERAARLDDKVKEELITTILHG